MDAIIEQLQAFWAEVVDVLNTGFLGQPIGRGVLALGVLLLAFLLRRLVAKIIISSIRRLAGKTKTEFDDQLVDALKQPLMLIPVTAGIFFAAQALGAEGQVDAFFVLLTRSLIILVIFWALYRLVRPLLHLATGIEERLGETFTSWAGKILKGIIFFVGAAAILDTWGVPVIPFLASLSLLSVAVALGAQDLFKNLIAGMTIIGERRFSKGDWIFVDGIVEGTVEDVSFRSTVVRRFDMAPVYVPNAKLADNSLTNFSRMTHRRIYWTIALEYRTTARQLETIRQRIAEHIEGSEDFVGAGDISTFVRIEAFDDSAINLMIYCFTRTTNWGEWLEIKERLAYAIKDIVEGEGAGFAFPSRSLYVERLPDGTPAEAFTPLEDGENAGKSEQKSPAAQKKSAATKTPAKKAQTPKRKPAAARSKSQGRAVETEGGDKGSAESGGDGGE